MKTNIILYNIKSCCADDLEMDFVAALEQQIHRTGGESNVGGDLPPNTIDNNLTNATDASFSPKEMRKFDSKKRWKNWGWKYSSPGKTSSIEEEPDEITSAKTSRHSSPTSSPKHKKSDKESAATVVSNLLNQSPLRRRPQSGQTTQSARANGKANNASNSNQTTMAANNRSDIRSSAGARLCQQFESLDDEMNDEFQALIINGRPASVHIVPMSSTQLQWEHENRN